MLSWHQGWDIPSGTVWRFEPIKQIKNIVFIEGKNKIKSMYKNKLYITGILFTSKSKFLMKPYVLFCVRYGNKKWYWYLKKVHPKEDFVALSFISSKFPCIKDEEFVIKKRELTPQECEKLFKKCVYELDENLEWNENYGRIITQNENKFVEMVNDKSIEHVFISQN